MPPATFRNEDTRKAFYEKLNKQVMEKYYNDPEFRKQKLDERKALYKKLKEDPVRAEALRVKNQQRYLAKKAAALELKQNANA